MSKKRLILVTGAASGIGLAITNYLAAKGDHVIAVDINKEALSKFEGQKMITPLQMDVTDSASITSAIEKIPSIKEGLDGLVNNAGIFVGGPLVEVEEQAMEKIIAVNVLGVFKVTKALFPYLLKKKGRIINIGSEVGRFSFMLNGPYSMSKYAIESFSDSLRRELMFLDMKVILLQVGAMQTDLLYRTYCSYAEDINFEQSHFQKLLKMVIKTCEQEMKRGCDPKVVAKKVYHVLTKRHPKPRYRIKNNKLRRLLEFLPTSFADFLLKKALR
ncbi:MAG: SDR family NAD(P)-dependent oxidoreductase [Candidatus Thorarchaeota archaeon]